MDTRRSFIKKSSAALAAALVFDRVSFSMRPATKLERFGYITGIIGKELKGDWKAVLKKTAEFGYSEIETGSYLGDSAESFLAYCQEIGLKPVAGGIDFKSTGDELLKSLQRLNELKVKYAVAYWPWFTGGPFTLEDCKKSAEQLNQLGKVCQENGLVFCWHNHDKEFPPMEEGLPFDYLMNNTDKNLVQCELDIYWAVKGGADPVDLMKKYAGRYVILHVKDMAPGDAKDFECPGSGIIDFPSVFREAQAQGIRHYMVERDNVPDGLACLQSAAEYLKKVTF
jgi:sugar phosphate isomerase/epimerase